MENDNPAVLALLLDRGADLDARDNDGMTPLHWAAHSVNSKVVELLLDRGADLDARDNDGKTPLHWAVHSVNSKVVELLLDRGADPKARTEDGETAWNLVQGNDALTGNDAYRRLRELLSD